MKVSSGTDEIILSSVSDHPVSINGELATCQRVLIFLHSVKDCPLHARKGLMIYISKVFTVTCSVSRTKDGKGSCLVVPGQFKMSFLNSGSLVVIQTN